MIFIDKPTPPETIPRKQKTIAMAASPEKSGKSILAPLIGTAIFFAVLCIFDYPKPMSDDLFYTGAALNMAGGGDFSNPLLARQAFPSHYFFVYPPFQAYAVYAWVSVFKVSAASLLAFQNLTYFIIAAMTMLILRWHRAPQFFLWLVPLSITAFFLKAGFRPEGFAVAATLAGYALFLYRGRNLWFAGIAFALLFLGAISAPRNGIFAAVFLIASGWEQMKSVKTANERARYVAVAAAALLAVLFVFCAMIHFRLAEFYQTFHLHSTRLGGNKIFLFLIFIKYVGTRCIPIYLLAAFFVIASLRLHMGSAERLGCGLALAFVASGFMGGLTWGNGWYASLIAFLSGGAFFSKAGPAAWRRFAKPAMVLVFLMANLTLAIQTFGEFTGNIVVTAPENADEVRSMRSTPEHPVLVTEPVCRYVFDYKIPPGFVLFEFSAPFPGFNATDAPLKAKDTFVLGPGALNMMNDRLHTHFPVETWSAFGLKNFTEYKYPKEARVLRVPEIKELMSRPSAK